MLLYGNGAGALRPCHEGQRTRRAFKCDAMRLCPELLRHEHDTAAREGSRRRCRERHRVRTRAGRSPPYLDHVRHEAQHVVEVDGVGGAQDAGVEAAGGWGGGGGAGRSSSNKLCVGGRSCSTRATEGRLM